MRVTFFSENAAPCALLRGGISDRGGAEKQIAVLARDLAAGGDEVSIMHGAPRATRPERVGGVMCYPVILSWRRLSSFLSFWRALRAIRPDAIYARLPHDFLVVIALYAKVNHNCRFVYALAHDDSCNPWREYSYKPWFHNPLYAVAMALADVVVVQHDGQRRLVERHVRGQLEYVPNLLEPVASTARDVDAASIDALWVAQVRPEKRLGCFLDLAAQLPNLRFAVVGAFDPTLPPEDRSVLERRMADLPNLDYLGLLSPAETMGAIRSARVLVNTSTAEGFPNTMLEAWSVGVPVSSLHVDPSGVIRRESLGLVSGSASSLAADVERLVSETSTNRTFGENGLRYVREHHRRDVVAAALDRVLGRAG